MSDVKFQFEYKGNKYIKILREKDISINNLEHIFRGMVLRMKVQGIIKEDLNYRIERVAKEIKERI